MGQQLGICCNSDTNSISSVKDQKFGRKDFIGIKTHLINNDYFFERQLGIGSYGVVHLGVNKKSKREVAIKKIQIDLRDLELIKMIYNEINVLVRCDHPNIVKIYDVYKAPENTYIVQEYIPHCKPITNLFQKEEEFNEMNRLLVIEKLLQTLNYLHQNDIVHRDIKTENVVYSQKKYISELNDSISNRSKVAQNYQTKDKYETSNYYTNQTFINFDRLDLKLIDFGFANINRKNKRELNEFLGTPYYMAPEIINGVKYGQEVDIWSLGIMAFYLIEFDFPFKGYNKTELFQNVKMNNMNFNSKVWIKVSAQCKDFIKQCLTQEQYKRPTAAQLLKHPWMQRHNIHLAYPVIDVLQKSIVSEHESTQLFSGKSLNEILINYFKSQPMGRGQIYDLRQMCTNIDQNRDGILNQDEIKILMNSQLGKQEYKTFLKIFTKLKGLKDNQFNYLEMFEYVISTPHSNSSQILFPDEVQPKNQKFDPSNPYDYQTWNGLTLEEENNDTNSSTQQANERQQLEIIPRLPNLAGHRSAPFQQDSFGFGNRYPNTARPDFDSNQINNDIEQDNEVILDSNNIFEQYRDRFAIWDCERRNYVFTPQKISPKTFSCRPHIRPANVQPKGNMIH
eukprot:403376257